MLISNKGPFLLGLFLALSFFGVLILIFAPVYGGGKNGLDYADDLFNKLSKGSSYFIPKLKEGNQSFLGRSFTAALYPDKPKEAELIQRLFTAAGCRVESQSGKLIIEGDLGKTVDLILRDADLMFHNHGREVQAAYGVGEKEVMRAWWSALSQMDKFFKKNLKIEESNHISEIIKKGVEPAYNFYQVESQRVIDRAGLMTFLLTFYIFYTIWWGYAIYYLFEGFGLTMKKAKVKKEV